MSKINLADPAFEPSDEQLMELSRKAFQDVGERRRQAEAKLRAEIARLRADRNKVRRSHRLP